MNYQDDVVLQKELVGQEYGKRDMMVDNLKEEEENDVGGLPRHGDDYKKTKKHYFYVAFVVQVSQC